MINNEIIYEFYLKKLNDLKIKLNEFNLINKSCFRISNNGLENSISIDSPPRQEDLELNMNLKQFVKDNGFSKADWYGHHSICLVLSVPDTKDLNKYERKIKLEQLKCNQKTEG